MSSEEVVFRPSLPIQHHKVYEDVSRRNQVLNEMHRFYCDERWVDVVLKVQEDSFPSHRLVLAASSMYFERMFTNGMCEEKAAEITLNQVTSCAIKQLLEFAYTSKLHLSTDHVLEIFEASDMLQFTGARKFCEQFLHDQVDCSNCLTFMVYADAFSSESLYTKAKQCAAVTFKDQIAKEVYFRLPLTHLISLLSDDSVSLAYEEHVYDAMIAWIMFDLPQRKQFVPELFRCIRLNYVSRWFLIEKISKDALLAEFPAAQSLISSAKDQLLAQGHTYEIPWLLPRSRTRTGLTRKIVYVCTHDPNPTTSEVHLFDPINKSWSRTSKPCPLASEFSTCESLNDTVLVVGGWSNQSAGKSLNERGAVSVIHEFRVMSIFPSLWYVGAHKMGIARYLHSTVVLNDSLYLVGGFDDSHCLQATMFVTDATHNFQFQVCPRLLYPVSRPALSTHNDQIYVFGGYGEGGVPRQFIQCFDTNTRQWCEVKPSAPGTFLSCSMACQYATFIDGKFYVFLGEKKYPHGVMSRMVGHLIPERVVDSVYSFDPFSKQWAHLCSFAEQLSGSVCFATLKKKVYITGGERNGVAHFCVDCYDPATNTLEAVGNTAADKGCLSLCATMKVMHENFGL